MTGFKQTAIGTLPEDWEVCEIKDLVLDTETRNPEKEPAKKIKYVDVSSVSNQTFSVIGHQDFLGKNAPGRARKVVYTNDVIFATVRPTLKRIAKISQEYNGEYCSTAFCVLRANKDKLNFEFLYQYLLTNFFVKEIAKYQSGASYPAVRDDDVKKTKMPYPPLNEQSNIAKILSIIQSAIEAQEKIIQTTTELKKALMQKLFTEGLKGEPQKETEIGLVPKSWDIKRVGDFCDVRSSSILFKDINKIKAQKETPIKVLALKVSDMNLAGNEDEVKSSQIEFYLENEDNYIKKLIPPLALIFPKRGAAISTNKKRITLHYSILDPNLMALLPTNKCNPNFLYLYFQRLDLRTISDKGLIPQLNKKDLMPVLVPMPSVDEQEEVVLTIKRIDAKIHINTDKLKTLQSLFKSMLHHLMTGQIRVKDLRFS